MLRWLLVIGVCSIGCTVEPVDLDGRRCPCVAGWVCDAVRGICVEDEGSLDAGATGDDAGSDAGRIDAGRLDAGSSDAGSRDGGAMDAGAMDGGATDGSGADGSADAGSIDTACDDLLSGALACTGFESASTPGWAPDVTEGTTAIVPSPTYRGAGALRGATTAGFGRAGVRAGLPSLTSGEVWARGYFYVPASVTLTDVVSFLFVYQATGAFPGVSAGVDPAMGAFVWATSDGYSPLAATFPRDTWVCVQLGVVISATAGAVILRLDDVEVGRVTGIDTRYTGTYDGVVAGLERAGAMQPTAEVFADEIAVGTTILPCD